MARLQLWAKWYGGDDRDLYWLKPTALEMLALMQAKFPAPEYNVTMMHWRMQGVDVTR